MKNKTQTARRGAAMIEFAFAFPIVLFLFFAMMEYGRYFMIKDLLQNAAREGARYAAVTTSLPADEVDDDQIIEWVNLWMVGQNNTLTGYDVTVFRTDNTGADLGDWKNAGYGQQIAVRIEGTHKAVLPVFPYLGQQLSLLRIISSEIDLDVRAVVVAESN
jgi:Flp pilus assembly protein TadG